jgi:radical SAM superfamily enzyme YgiQ (UPF0313 family)
MKVLLINSNFPQSCGITHLPLVLAYPAAVLQKNHHEVKVIDLAVQELTKEAITEEIRLYAPEIIVINSETTVLQTRDYCYALELSRWIKKIFPNIHLAMMGAHVTFRDKETLDRQQHIDFIIRHEAEYVLLNLVNALDNNKGLEDIKGTTYRKDKKIIQNELEPPIEDLDSLPLPARDLFPIGKYLEKDDETIVQGSRGCTNKCYFCQSSAMDRTLRFRKIPLLIKEINDVLRLGFKSVYFADYDFCIEKTRVFEFCNKIIANKIKFRWACNMRADRINNDKESHEMLRQMKKAGCYRVFVGFESISPKVLNNIKKEVTPDKLNQAARILKEFGIGLHASFLFGLPGDTEETIKTTVKFAKRIKPQMVSFNLLTPYPGTMLGDKPSLFGIIVNDPIWYEKVSLSNHNVSGNKNLTSKKLQELANWAYKEFLGGN